MYRSFLLSACLTCFAADMLAQTAPSVLYIPRDIKLAVKKGTRSPDGKPGPNYWQNTGRYHIVLTALPPDRTIQGSETITYRNNSPDTLRQLVIRLIQNIHKPGVARYGDTDSTYFNSGVHVDRYTENGAEHHWTEPQSHATWQTVTLNTALLPHDSVRLSFDWHFEISLRSGREGMIDSTTYYLAYFYPRVSVYDDYNGWDKLNFTDGQEFYNDFNDYTLDVKVPANYIVWATGTLQNPGEVLQPSAAQRMVQSLTSDSVLHIATYDDLMANNVTATASVNTWKWSASDITDVTVGLSDHYDWDGGSVVVDESTGRRTAVQAAFNNKANDFHHMVGFGIHAIGWYSRHWPGVAFPFPKMTVFQGFADMEYPMMVNDGSTPDLNFSRLVADHEIAHSYFPFYMGINESRYAFMDEGWATTLELLIGRTELGGDSANVFYRNFRVTRWINDPSTNEDLPIVTPSNNLSGVAYGNNSYGKASLGYLAMMDLLGEDQFKKCLHVYMDRWHGKHPIPWDFFYSLNDASGRNLNWFWNNWYFSNGYIDLAIRNVVGSKGGDVVTIENIGGFDAPFDLIVTYTDGSKETFHSTPDVWRTGKTTIQVALATAKSIKAVVMDGGIFMDADVSNNSWQAP